MPYCQGCGRYTGEYSSFHVIEPGRGEIVLCRKCKQWVDKHPGRDKLPKRNVYPPAEEKRLKTFSVIYIISALGLFVLGTLFVISGNWIGTGSLFLLGALSLLLIGIGMKRSSEKSQRR